MLGYRRPSTGTLPGRLRKDLKRVPGPLGPGVKKGSKGVKNDYFSSFFRLVFDSFSTFFRAYWPPLPRGPGNPFSDSFQILFRVFQGEAFLTPSDGQRYPNLCAFFWALFSLDNEVAPLLHSKDTKSMQGAHSAVVWGGCSRANVFWFELDMLRRLACSKHQRWPL